MVARRGKVIFLSSYPPVICRASVINPLCAHESYSILVVLGAFTCTSIYTEIEHLKSSGSLKENRRRKEVQWDWERDESNECVKMPKIYYTCIRVSEGEAGESAQC